MATITQPCAEEIRAVRADSKLTQAEAAALVHLGHRMRWTEYETGVRNIDLARWELFLLKTNQHPALVARRRT